MATGDKGLNPVNKLLPPETAEVVVDDTDAEVPENESKLPIAVDDELAEGLTKVAADAEVELADMGGPSTPLDRYAPLLLHSYNVVVDFLDTQLLKHPGFVALLRLFRNAAPN